MAQLFNLFRFKLKILVTFEFFRLEQWGMVLQSKIVAPSKRPGLGGDRVENKHRFSFFWREKTKVFKNVQK